MTIHKLMCYLTISIVSLLLIVATLFKLPYGFYMFLKIVVTGYCIYEIYQLYQIYKNNLNYYIIYVLIAVLYNPIIRIQLNKPLWNIINIITIVLFWVSYIFIFKRNK